MSSAERKQMVDDLVEGLAERGLVVVPAALVDDALRLQKAKTKMMRRNKLTPYEVSKFKLLPNAPSLNTIKKMIEDGRIKADETFVDRKNKTYITRGCINRLNGVV